MVLVDSSVWINFFSGKVSSKTELFITLLDSEQILVGDIIVMEVLQGFPLDAHFDDAMSLFSDLECVSLGGRQNAVVAAQNYRSLRKKGITVRKSIDMLIATWCIQNQVPLLHIDRDFEMIARYLPLVLR